MCNNNGFCGCFGNNIWWIIILLVLFCGCGNNGMGFNNNGGCGCDNNSCGCC